MQNPHSQQYVKILSVSVNINEEKFIQTLALKKFFFLLQQNGTRYDGQIAVFGSAFQEKLERQKYFLVRPALVF